MRRLLLPSCLALAVAAGCKSAPPDAPYPNDPLLVSKKPIEGKLETARPVLVVHHEPAVPLPPAEALVQRPLPPDESGVQVLAYHVNKE
jgi:hypothetical protein